MSTPSHKHPNRVRGICDPCLSLRRMSKPDPPTLDTISGIDTSQSSIFLHKSCHCRLGQDGRYKSPVAKDLRKVEVQASQQGTTTLRQPTSPQVQGSVYSYCCYRFVSTVARRTQHGPPCPSASTYVSTAPRIIETLVSTSPSSDLRIWMVRLQLLLAGNMILIWCSMAMGSTTHDESGRQ